MSILYLKRLSYLIILFDFVGSVREVKSQGWGENVLQSRTSVKILIGVPKNILTTLPVFRVLACFSFCFWRHLWDLRFFLRVCIAGLFVSIHIEFVPYCVSIGVFSIGRVFHWSCSVHF